MSFLGWVGVSVEERDGHGVWMQSSEGTQVFISFILTCSEFKGSSRGPGKPYLCS